MDLTDDPVVSPAWLVEHLSGAAVRPVDATWYFPHEGRDADAEFAAEHIPKAVRFDIDRIADAAVDLPHMLPTPGDFAADVSALGLNSSDLIIVYETTPPRSAARVWWSLRAMGHERVRVLDGGLSAWKAVGGPVATGAAVTTPGRFAARLRADLVSARDEVAEALTRSTAQVLDARPAARFSGEAAEPRDGLRRGHMPGALSMPASSLFDAKGALLPTPDLLARLEAAGGDASRATIATCGSGVTACLIALAFARLGRTDVKIYDGSFAEWGRLNGGPVVVS